MNRKEYDEASMFSLSGTGMGKVHEGVGAFLLLHLWAWDVQGTVEASD